MSKYDNSEYRVPARSDKETIRDLLEALEILVDYCDRNFFQDVHITKEPYAMRNAREVIAKTTGK